MQSTQRPIVVVGSINMDMVSSVPRIPRAGETLFGTGFELHPGGKGANQAVGVSRLGCPVTMLGAVGRDAFGKQLREHLESEGVGTQALLEVDAPTGTASILVDAEGENCIVVTPGANFFVTPEAVRDARALIAGASAVLAQLEIPMESIEALAELCLECNVPLILDPAPARPLSPAVFAAAAWLTPNETEAQFYVGEGASGQSACEQLFHLGVQAIVLKQGARGSVIAQRGRPTVSVPAVSVQAIDTTAAGDAFNAAFAVGLVSGSSPQQSARFAAAAAAISVTRRGAQPSLARYPEVMEALQAALRSGSSVS